MPPPRSPACDFDKGPEDPAIGLVDLEFRMPLDAEAKAMARVFDALDDAVLGDGVDDEAGPGLLDRLMMRAVDAEVLDPGDAVQQVPAITRTVCPGSFRGFGWRCATQPGTSSGMCWIRVPPSTTFNSCWPPQIPSTGIPLARAPLAAASSKAVRRSLVLTLGWRVGCTEQRRIDVEAAAGDDEPVDLIEISQKRRRGRAAAGSAAHRRGGPHCSSSRGSHTTETSSSRRAARDRG